MVITQVHAKIKVNGQLVQKTEWKRTHTADLITWSVIITVNEKS